MPLQNEPLIIARGATPLGLYPEMGNRHGLIAGATGTGKTVTLRVLAEQFSSIGVPVFMADVKGDLSGMACPGGENVRVTERVRQFGYDTFTYTGFPLAFWDILGDRGHPVRTTVTEMGPMIISRLLN